MADSGTAVDICGHTGGPGEYVPESVDPDIYRVAHGFDDSHADRVTDSDKYASGEHGHIYKDQYPDIHKYSNADRDSDKYAVTAKHTDKFPHVNVHGDKDFNAHCYPDIDQSAVPDIYRNFDIYRDRDLYRNEVPDADMYRYFHRDAVALLNSVIYSDVHGDVHIHQDLDRHFHADVYNNKHAYGQPHGHALRGLADRHAFSD
jgi:hypothetical protein